jgi:hypothetical protein
MIKQNKVDFIPKSKGIATVGKPHYYSIRIKGEDAPVSVVIKARQIKEHIERSDSQAGLPINYVDEVTSTQLSIIRLSDNSVIFEATTEGEAGDEWVLAQYGYYVTNFDETQEVKRMKRLIDLAKYL